MGDKFLKFIKFIKKKFHALKFRNSFLAKYLPVVIMALVIGGLIALNIVTRTSSDKITVTEDGFLIVSNNKISSIKNVEDGDTLEIVNVMVGNNVYRNAATSYIKETKQNIDLSYPFFINNGLTLLMYTSNFNIIDSELRRSTGYENMMISGGKIYDIHDYNQIDDENYILISYANGIYVNLFEMVVTTLNGTYKIPVNSFVYFAKDQINYYARSEEGFTAGIIPAVSLDSLIDFKNDITNDVYQYEYESFLSGLGTVYKEEKAPEPEKIIIEEPIEEVSKEPKEYHYVKPVVDKEFVWIKPEVTAGDFTGSIYRATGTIKIKDPAKVITKSPTFSFYVNGKLQMRRTFTGSGNITVSGLLPNTKYTVIGEYVYLAEDMETKINVTFYGGSFETKEVSNLDPIELSFGLSEYYSTKIRIDDLKVVGDLKNEALSGVSRIAIEIEGVQYSLGTAQASYVINGLPVSVSTPDALKSRHDYDFTIKFFDTTGAELKVLNNTGSWHTSALEPSVVMKVVDQDVDSISIRVKLKNKDDVLMENYRYVVTDSGGNIVSADAINYDGLVTLSNLTANALFNIKAYADIDTDNGKGLVADYQLGSLDFTSLSLGGLGFMNISLENEQDSYDTVTFDAKINTRKTNVVLTRLVSSITFSVINGDGKVVASQVIKGASLESMKNEEAYDLKFTGLNYNTSYTLKAVAYATQGDAKYENACFLTVESFTTTKRPAEVLISSMYTTGNMTDFDVAVKDLDGSILVDDVWVELRNSEGVLIKSLKIGKNQETPERITFDHLTQDATYSIIFYVDEYNLTNKGATYQSHYILKTVGITTEEGISGSISLLSSRRVGNGDNLIDPYSTAKWIRARGDSYWNGAQPTVDDDGIIHLKALNTGWVYYNYDLSDYHGHVVKVSFKVKAAADPTDFYFRQYLFSSGGTKINATTDGWTSYETTIMVGYTGSATTSFSPSSAKSYEKYVYDYINFNFAGKASKKTEYLIKDFQVYQYDLDNKEVIDTSDINLEYGYWDTRGKKQSSTTRIRYDRIIEIEKEGWYEMPFFLDSNEYTMYMYIYTEGQTSATWSGAGWYSYSVVKYLKANSKIAVFFMRANGNLTPEPTAEINKEITGAIKSDKEIPFGEFTYDFITSVKVNIEDKRGEIATNDYYIRAKNSNGEYVLENRYEELEDEKKLENIIKKIQLDEGGQFTVYLSVKIRDRFYDLSSFNINTTKEIIGVSTLNDYFWIQPDADYAILNDLDFTGVTWYLGRSSYDQRQGVIDYQGHTMTTEMQSNSNITRHFYYLGTNSVIKNLVLDIHITGDTTNNAWMAWVYQNRGLIENIYINIYNADGVIQDNTYRNGYNNILVNRNYGTINNFIFELKDDLKITGAFGLVTLYNYGTISNGYTFGEAIDMTKGATNVAFPKLIAGTSSFGSTIKNIFVLNKVKIPSKSTVAQGVLVGTLGGNMNGVYYIGDSNPSKLTVGPLVTTAQSAADFSRSYYLSEYIYTSGVGQKIPMLSLHNVAFQQNTLGDQFDIEDLVAQGYYPQLKFSSDNMPYQTYLELPKKESSLIDVLSSEVLESTDNTAKVKLIINNPYGETISSITIADLTTEIVEQTYENGVSNVIINLSEPNSYKSKYAIHTIVSTYENIPTTKTFLEGERYVAVDMYKEIWTTSDWLQITKNLSWNYVVKDDLDFGSLAKFSIGNFRGKLKGNNHTISNIFLDGMYGLFYSLYGQIYDLNFYNVQKHDLYGGRMGLINYTYTGALLDDVHVDTIILEAPDSYTTTGSSSIGGLVAELRNAAAIYNSSVKNVKITSHNGRIVNMYIGGMFGYVAESDTVLNCFAENVDITATNTVTSYVGGLAGRIDNGVFDATYVTGKISNQGSQGTGGYTAYFAPNGSITNSIAMVDISSDRVNTGGFIGTLTTSTSASKNNLYMGHIFVNTEKNVHQFIGSRGSYTFSEENYVTDDVLVNGKTWATDFEQVIQKSDLINAETYTEGMGFDVSYDYSRVDEFILPKLFKYNSATDHVEDQSDISLGDATLEAVSVNARKQANNAVVTVQFKNPTNLEVTGLKVEGMTIATINNITRQMLNDDGIMVAEVTFTATADKYRDIYRLSEVYYNDTDGNPKTAYQYAAIEVSFYGEIWTLADWQALDPSDPQNYFLMADLDFSQLPEGETINYGVVFNRLVTESDTIKHTIKNVNITTPKNTYRIGLIREINTELSGVIFDNINISSVSTSIMFGTIVYIYGDVRNCELKNSTIAAPSVAYVGGLVASASAVSSFDNIIIDNVTVKGRQYIGGLFGSFGAGTLKNIYATNITVDATGYTSATSYIGGLIGSSSTSEGDAYINRYENINISDSTVTASTTNSSYVGGAIGYGGCENLTVDNVTVTGWKYVGGGYGVGRAYATDSIVKNGHVAGDTHVGGFSGQGGGATFYTEGSAVYNMAVVGVTNVGGFHGYAYLPSDYGRINAGTNYGVAVLNTSISGITNVGGMYGSVYYTYNLSAYLDGVTISGESNVGGLAGKDTNYAFYNNYGTRMVNSTITATVANAGGIVGYVESGNSSYSRYVSFENVDIYAGENAGAFYGKHCATLSANYYNNYGLYFDGTISTDKKSTAGIVVGEDLTGKITSVTKWYGLYEGSKLNGVELKNLNYDTTTIQATLSKNSLKTGFLNTSTGAVYTNYSYVNAAYWDNILLEAGKTYTFHFNPVGDDSPIFMPYYYEATDAKKFINVASNGNVSRYIQSSFSTDYYKEQTIRVLQDCYLKLLVYYPDRLASATVDIESSNNYGNISRDRILTAEELRKRLTWTGTYSNDSTLTGVLKTTLNMSSTYYDFSTIGNELEAVTVTDLSGNGADGTAYVSGATSDGMWFDGVDDYIEVNNNYNGALTDYTIIAWMTNVKGLTRAVIFDYMRDSDGLGYYGLAMNYTTPMPLFGSSNYSGSNGTNIPYNTNTMVAVSYKSSTGALREYENGRFDYTRTTTKNLVNAPSAGGTAYIGKKTGNYNGSTTFSYFFGVISKVMVFDHVLTDSEVAAIYQAGAPVDNTGLRLYYDLTEYQSAQSGGYYPELYTKYVTPFATQAHIALPPLNQLNNAPLMAMSTMGSFESVAKNGITLEDCYNVYTSGANTVNLEFEAETPSDATFSYSYGDYTSETMNLDQRVYSINYNFKDDLTFNFKTASEEYSTTISASDLAKKIAMDGENYYYINPDGALYVGSEWLIDGAVNLFKNTALLENDHLYDIETRTELSDYTFQNGVRADEVPLYTSKIGAKTVQAFYNFSVVSSGETSAVREKQIVMNNNITYIYDQDGRNDNLVFNKYNGKIYQFGLSSDGGIITYQTSMKTDRMFNNTEIAEITFDSKNTNPTMMIRYKNGFVKVLDYYSGSTIFSSGDEPSMSLSQFVGAVFTGGAILPTMTSSYEKSEELIDAIGKIDDAEIIKNIAISTDLNNNSTPSASADSADGGSADGGSQDGEGGASSGSESAGENSGNKNTKVVNNYASVYNEEKGEYEVYNVNDLLDPTLDESATSSIEEKAEANAFLYKYLYGDKKDETISESKILIYSAIIIVVVINLGLFIKRFKKHEKI